METAKNILRAIAGESMARNKYTYFASKAKAEGYEQIAGVFLETADNEKEHAKRLMKLIKDDSVKSSLSEFDFPTVDTTVENLKHAAAGENWEHTKMYPEFAKTAKEEGELEAELVFTEISEVEEEHEKRYLKLADNVSKGEVFRRDKEVAWKCRNCGYVHHGTEAPEVCPACAHPRAYYELQCENY
jgi:rubrerythrin